MKKILALTCCLVLLAVPLFAQVVTFSITSSAKTATPNLSLTCMYGPLQITPGFSGPGSVMQAPVIDTITSYYLTKTQVVDLTKDLTGGKPCAYVRVQAAQDTKMYVGADLTNYWTIYSGVDDGFAPRWP